MCGKFTQLSTWRQVHAFSQPLTLDGDVLVTTPMRDAFVLRLDADGRRETVPMRWGFADRNAKTPARPKHMHVRSETIDERPTFAAAFAQRRGIVVATTFNEGEELPNGKKKQWVITPKDGAPIAFAVLWEEWENGAERLLTFVQVTTPANALITPVTDRMPAILRPEDWPVWLGETNAGAAELKALLRTFEDDGAWSIAEQGRTRQPELF